METAFRDVSVGLRSTPGESGRVSVLLETAQVHTQLGSGPHFFKNQCPSFMVV